MINIRRLLTCLASVVLVAAFSTAIFAQSRASLRGQISDEFGASIVGATVALTDASGAQKTATTNADGNYSFTGLAPGKYKARITFKGQSSETELEIISDPHVTATPAEWAAQQEFLKHAGDQFDELHKSVNSLRQVKKQVDTYNESLKNVPDAKDFVNMGKELNKKIEKWESNLIEPRSKNFQDVINFPNKLNSEFLQIRGVADQHDPRLTKGAQDRARDVQADWAKFKMQMNQLIEKDISDYNRTFKEKNMPALMPEKKDVVINN